MRHDTVWRLSWHIRAHTCSKRLTILLTRKGYLCRAAVCKTSGLSLMAEIRSPLWLANFGSFES